MADDQRVGWAVPTSLALQSQALPVGTAHPTRLVPVNLLDRPPRKGLDPRQIGVYTPFMAAKDAETLKQSCRVVASGCAGSNIRRASRVISQVYARALAPVDLEVSQFTVLIAAGATGGVPLSNLADVLAMDRTTLSRNLKPLQRRGLVTVAAGKDRRVRLVSLTPAGSALLQKALPLWQQAQERVIAALGRPRF